MKNFIKIFTAFFTAFSTVSTVHAITVDSAAYTGTRAYPIGGTGFCEVSSLDEIVLFSTPDNNSLADYFYAGITDSTGTLPRGVTSSGAPNLGSQQGNSLYRGDQSITAIVLQSDFSGPNAPTVSDPWYWTVWEGTANDPNAYYNSGTTRGAIVAQFPIADSVWDNPPGASGSNPCRPAVQNAAPAANAGSDQTTLRPNVTVTLDGSVSSDADGDSLTYLWTQLSGPTVTLDDSTLVSPSFTIPFDAVDTPIIFQLIVNDGTVDSSSDQVSFQAVNSVPIANAGIDQLDPRPNDIVALDGSASSDDDGDVLTYLWTQVSGPVATLNDATLAAPTFTIPLDAIDTSIVFNLVVNDGFESSPPDMVTIMAQNEAPIADAGLDQSDVTPGNNIDLDGSGSFDPDGDSLTFLWTQLSGTTVAISDSNTATPSFIAPRGGGELTFELIISDGFVDSTPDQVSITVQDNVAVATKAISEFLTVRNSLLLSNQPDLQRRIDRLEGRGGKRGASSVSGIPVIGTSKLPVQIAMNGNNTTVSGSLTGLKNPDGNREVSETGSLDIWGEAYISSFNIDNRSGDFGIYYLGADYLITEGLLIGVLGQLDKIDFDDNVLNGVTDGEGWMAGPYVTARLSDNLYADARASFGKSENTVSPFGTYTDEFETSRYLLAGSLTGEFDLSDTVTFRPEGNLKYLSETQDSYTDALGSSIPEQSSEQGQLSVAPRLQYNFTNDSGFLFRPYAEIEGTHSFGDGVNSILGNDMRFRLEGGADMFSAGGFRASLSYFEDGIGTDNYDENGFRLSGAFTF